MVGYGIAIARTLRIPHPAARRPLDASDSDTATSSDLGGVVRNSLRGIYGLD